MPNPVPPPPPPPPSGSDRPGGGSQVYAFLVGIDQYAHISNLSGCKTDVNNIENYLLWRYGVEQAKTTDVEPDIALQEQNGVLLESISNNDTNTITRSSYLLPKVFQENNFSRLNILKITDSAATYRGVIDNFKAFLGVGNSDPNIGAWAQDSVWFHFSGHGAEAPSASEFINLESGRDQCLLCHDAVINKETGAFNHLLADKEIAALLSDLATGPKGTPHILVTFDSCFSGGGTRFGNERIIALPDSSFADASNRRSIASYYNGYYTNQMLSNNTTQPLVPIASHTVITACDNIEVATEDNGGVFTQALLEVLRNENGAASYAELIIRVRALVSRFIESKFETRKQTPQFDVLGGAKPYARFLDGTPLVVPDRYEVDFKEFWYISLGAIHGLSTNVQDVRNENGEEALVKIYAHVPGQQGDGPVLAEARIVEVGPQYSKLELIGIQEESPEEEVLFDPEFLYGKLNFIPAPPVYVLVSGNAQQTEGFINGWRAFTPINTKNIRFITQADAEKPHTLSVIVNDLGCQINDGQTGKQLMREYGMSSQTDVMEATMVDLIKIVNWRRLLALENPDSALNEKIRLGINLQGKNNIRLLSNHFEGAQIGFTASTETGIVPRGRIHKRSLFYHLLPKITITGGTERLFFYLYSMWSSYKIDSEPETSRNEVAAGEVGVLEFPFKNDRNWGLTSVEESDTLHLKLIVSTKELDYHQLYQDGISSFRGEAIAGLGEGEGFADWCTVTMRLDLTREGVDVSPGRGEDVTEHTTNAERQNTLGFTSSHAFVIGINHYKGLGASLETASGDAEDIAKRLKVLQRFDNVLLMNDVGKAQVQALLNWLSNENRSGNFTIANQAFPSEDNPEYQSRIGWLKLASEINEADKSNLEQIELVTDEDSEDKKQTLLYIDPVNTLSVGQNDAIVFYYAGHGFPGEGSQGPAGFLAPTDAKNKMFDNDSLISMDEVYRALLDANCMHTLLILDCCFAGKFRFINSGRGESHAFLMPMYQRRFERYKTSNAWQVLVSAGPEQTAADSAAWANIRNNSPFAATLKAALEGKADFSISANRGKSSGDGIITATELFLYVWDKVEQITSENKPQHPGLFPMERHRQGEFIFLNPKISADQFDFAEDPRKNPYKGLVPYEKGDAKLFFGRIRAINEVKTQLLDQQLLFITGPSGSGKSSLVKAGIIASLPEFKDLVVRPSELLIPATENSLSRFDQIVEQIKIATEKVEKIVLLIDQYEELLMHVRKDDLQAKVVQLVDKVLADPNNRVLFTMRSDFEWQMPSTPLSAYWAKKRIYRVPPVDLDELREVITGPAWWAMFDFKENAASETDNGESLINEILADFANAPGALPLVSFTMHTLFAEAQKLDLQTLTADLYRNVVQGVEGAISAKANQLYNDPELTMEEKDMIRKVLLRMVQLYDGSLGRRRVYLSTKENTLDHLGNRILNELDFPGQEELVKTVIQKLEAGGLIILNTDDSGSIYAEPAHDALITHWNTCRQWLDEFGKDNLLLQRKLWDTVLDYSKEKQNGRIKSSPFNNKEDLAAAFTPTWEFNPKLEEVTKYILDPQNNWLKRLDPLLVEEVAQLIWNEPLSPQQLSLLKTHERIQVQEAPILQILHKNATLNGEQLSRDLSDTENLEEAIKNQMDNWLNAPEINFIKQSWRLRQSLIAQLKKERDEAERTAKRAVSDYYAYRAKVETDRTIAFRLAQFAAFIDPTAPNALEQLVARYYFTKYEPVHVSLIGSDAAILSLGIHPHKDIIAASDAVGYFRVWDATNARELAELKVGSGSAICFSREGSLLLTGNYDGVISVWDVENFAIDPLATISTELTGGRVLFLDISPDNQKVLSLGNNGKIKIWKLGWPPLDFLTPENEFDLSGGHTTAIVKAKFIDNNRIVTIADEGNNDLVVWDIVNGQASLVLAGLNGSPSISNSLHPNHPHLYYAASYNNTIKRWNLTDGSMDNWQIADSIDQGYFDGLSISPNGIYLAVGIFSGFNRYNIYNNQIDIVARAHGTLDGSVTDVAYLPSGNKIATSSWDRIVRVWDLNSMDSSFCTVFQRNNGEHYRIKSLVLNLEGDGYILICDDNISRVGGLQKEMASIFTDHSKTVNGAVLSQKGDKLVFATENSLEVWTVGNDESQTKTEIRHGVPATCVAFTFDETKLLSGTENGVVNLWDLSTGTLVNNFGQESGHKVNAIAFSPKLSDQFATVHADDTIKIWQMPASEKPMKTIHPGLGGGIVLAFSPDGSKMAVCGFELARVYSTDNWEELYYLSHPNQVWHVTFSPDSSKIATVCEDGTARIWNAQTAELMVPIHHQFHRHGFSTIWSQFGPDNDRIFIVSGDRVSAYWVDPEKLVAEATSRFHFSPFTPDQIQDYELTKHIDFIKLIEENTPHSSLTDIYHEEFQYSLARFLWTKNTGNQELKSFYLSQAKKLLKLAKQKGSAHPARVYDRIISWIDERLR